jgi:hypothetical protein
LYDSSNKNSQSIGAIIITYPFVLVVLLFDIPFFFQISVTESTPSNATQANKKESIIVGACLQVIEQYINIPIQTNQPNTPHTLLEDIPECEVTIYLINVIIFFIVILRLL